jgi:hypothetical protein
MLGNRGCGYAEGAFSSAGVKGFPYLAAVAFSPRHNLPLNRIGPFDLGQRQAAGLAGKLSVNS